MVFSGRLFVLSIVFSRLIHVSVLWIMSMNVMSTSYADLIIATLGVLVKKIHEQVAAGCDDRARVMQRIPLGTLVNITYSVSGTFRTFWPMFLLVASSLDEPSLQSECQTPLSLSSSLCYCVASRPLFSGRSGMSLPFKDQEESGWSLQKPKSPWIRTRWAWKVQWRGGYGCSQAFCVESMCMSAKSSLKYHLW